MDTVSKQLVVDKWDSRLLIYKLKEFKDDRGMVCETFRCDDVMTQDVKMCYISETNPYVMRGPHQHTSQVDNFLTWKDRMLYQFFNPEEMESFDFMTDKDSIYMIVVGVGIIHSYRNLETYIIRTMNYPTSLFMGKGKKEQIDEIRHEHILEGNDTVVVIGAGGRLGKSLVTSLLEKLDYYDCNIIPIFDRVITEYQVEKMFNNLKTVCTGKTYIVNCAGKTNVQSEDIWSEFFESNCQLPFLLQFYCFKEGWKFITFSTDYIYQKGEVSNYSKSKKIAEDEIISEASAHPKPMTTILRVCNLFSDDPSDTHNIIGKLWNKVINGGIVDYDPRITFSPTDVRIIADLVAAELLKGDSELFTDDLVVRNLVSDKIYTVESFLKQFFNYTNINSVEGKIEPWFDKFYLDKKKITILNSDSSIINIINRLNRLKGDTL